MRKITEKMNVPEGMGVILRTVCQGQRARYLIRDLNMLLEQWYQIEELRQNEKAPLCVFQEPDLIERTVRDFLTDEVAEVICDDEETVKRMIGLVGKVSRRSRKRVHYFTDNQPIFDSFRIEKQLSNAFKRQVWLPCGGYIVIDETEALISIVTHYIIARSSVFLASCCFSNRIRRRKYLEPVWKYYTEST